MKAEKSDSTHLSMNGQLTGWGITQFGDPMREQLGTRFVPMLLGDFRLNSNSKLDFETSLNISAGAYFSGFRNDTLVGELKPYRIWVRYSGDNWEVRAGLQKINFGSAKMFRPLMWFDGMDIRDPLQLTDGVYGVLSKYFFPNNMNLWFWGLIGNKKPKGFEMWGTSNWKPEIGGRIELPLGKGELGLSTHHRRVQYPDVNSVVHKWNESNESRVGLNGKWDVGVGLWFESGITFTDTQERNYPLVFNVQDLWNVGADYTFPLGNGLGATVEYFRYHAGNEFLVGGSALNVVGTMLTYPVSLLDNLSGMLFYLPDQNQTMNYFSWTRTYDDWSIYLIAYLNPENIRLLSAQAQSKNIFAGKGLQLMVNYNF